MRTVLIFDSSSVTCHTVSKQLRTYGFDAIQARSLANARLALASRPVDLVILDLAVPSDPCASDAGGLTLLRELRRDRIHQNTPVIILTSSARDSDRIDARAAGAVAFLTKPVSTRELLSTVSNALMLHSPAWQVPAPQVPARQVPAPQAERAAGSPAPRIPLRREPRPELALSSSWAAQ